MTPEPSAPPDTPPHARPYRPFTVNGPYGAHRIYSYRGPWMPPMDYGADPRYMRYVNRLSLIRGLAPPVFSILITQLMLMARNGLARLPAAQFVGQIGARLFPAIADVGEARAHPLVWQVAMTWNILLMVIIVVVVEILWVQVYQRHGFSDLLIMLINKRWRPFNRGVCPQRVSKRIFYGQTVLFAGILLLVGQAFLGLWIRHPNFILIGADGGLFDGRLFTRPPVAPFYAPMVAARHAMSALRYLMIGQDVIVWMTLSGVFFTAMWPWRRAAYRNDQAYLRARMAVGLDNRECK